MLAALASHGKYYSILNSFRYMLTDYAVIKICDCTTLHLVAAGHKDLTNTNEYYKYLATKMLRNKCRTGLSLAFKTMNLIDKSDFLR